MNYTSKPEAMLQWDKFAKSLPITFKSVSDAHRHYSSHFSEPSYLSVVMQDILDNVESCYATAVEYRDAARAYADEHNYWHEAAMEYFRIFENYAHCTDNFRKWMKSNEIISTYQSQ